MIYSRVVKPLLFRLSPEKAHALGMVALRAAAPFAFLGRWGRADDPRLRVTLGRGADALTFPNPVGLAAGFDKDGVALPGLSALGFGFLEAGTVTPRPQPGNDRPRLWRFPAQRALINRMGFNNDGLDALAARWNRAPDLGIPVGANIGKNKNTPNDQAVDDYLAGIDRLFDRADFFVVNVSSPNTPGLRDLLAPEQLGPLLGALRGRVDRWMSERRKPKRPLLFVKISPDDSPGEALVETVVDAGFDGIVATNTTRDRAGLPPGAPAEGGVSGEPLRIRSTDIVRRLFRAARGRLALIGAGGVFNAADAYEKIQAGASLVEIYTGFVYGGPGVVRNINRGLLKAMKDQKWDSIQNAVGSRA